MIELYVQARWIFEYKSLEPAFGRRAIEIVLRVRSERVAVQVQLSNVAFERENLRGRQFLGGFADAEKQAFARPAGEFEAAEAKYEFTRFPWNAGFKSRRRCPESSRGFSRANRGQPPGLTPRLAAKSGSCPGSPRPPGRFFSSATLAR